MIVYAYFSLIIVFIATVIIMYIYMSEDKSQKSKTAEFINVLSAALLIGINVNMLASKFISVP